MNEILFSSNKEDWETPQEIFDRLNKEFNFTIDVACDITNNKCERYYTEIENSLMQDWSNETVWCNPPYRKKYRRMG